jgi:GTP-binding protein HflX
MNRGPTRERQVLESPLSARWVPSERERAVLVGSGPGATEEDLDELAALAGSAGAEPIARLVQSRAEPDPATYLGRGKLGELHDLVHSLDARLVIFDRELSAGQLRDLESDLGVKVIDRTALILDIFALHAQSREGKAQVELAQLNYLLPRLRGWGEAMSRLGGGIGTRGPGETKLEVDRQHIRRRITKLRRDIKDLERTRDVKRSRRTRSGITQVAISGYTNSGKSTLLRRLTGAEAVVANQLFATLDTMTRRLELPGGTSITLSDTVGFVRDLPHGLVEAFRSTLEEVVDADLILHIADASSPELSDQIDAVIAVLGEIGAAGIDRMLVLNKIDLAPGSRRARLAREHPGSVQVSARTGEGVAELIGAVEAAVPRPPFEVTLLVPYGREEVTSALYRNGEVISTDPRDDGMLIRARVRERDLAGLKGFRV